MASHYILEVKYTRGELLGEGGFGKVYKAHEEKQGTLYAVKDILCKKNEDIDDAVNEIRALGKLIHENIIKLYNVRATQEDPFQATISLLTEYCGGGNLNDRLNKPSSKSKEYRWMLQIIGAVEFLHNRGIIHRDLKPENVLLTSSEVVKLADFGLATRFARKNDNQSWYEYYIEHGVGQACFIAPEVLLKRYTYKADIFSVGVIFYAILERSSLDVNGDNLFGIFVADGRRQQPLGLVMYNRKRDVELQFRKTRPQAVVELLKRTVKYDYKKRPTAEEIKVIMKQYPPTSDSCVIS